MKKSLIIVDIQPFYHKYHQNITPNLLDYIRNNLSNYENILWFFNAEEVGIEDTIYDMDNYILEHGILDEDDIDSIVFIDKYYAFFRNWMDNGVDEDFIKRVVRYMINEDVVDSRDLDPEDLKMLIETYYDLPLDEFAEDYHSEYDIMNSEDIHIPHFEWGAIKNLKSVDVCGGGRNECLLEMEILLEAVDVSVNKLEQFIY